MLIGINVTHFCGRFISFTHLREFYRSMKSDTMGKISYAVFRIRNNTPIPHSHTCLPKPQRSRSGIRIQLSNIRDPGSNVLTKPMMLMGKVIRQCCRYFTDIKRTNSGEGPFIYGCLRTNQMVSEYLTIQYRKSN
jgi:hypothetical protein